MVIGHFTAVADPPVAVRFVPPNAIVFHGAPDAFIDAPRGTLGRRVHQLVTAVEHSPTRGKRTNLYLLGTKFVRREFVVVRLI